MADPKLFQIRRMVITRDHKILAVFSLFVGGFIGRAILQAIGAAGTLGVGTAMRFVIALSWFFIPGKPVAKAPKEKQGIA